MNSFIIDENHKDSAFAPMGSDNMKIKKAQVNGLAWSDLPSPVVENIYSFLNRADQISMSSVCRNWRNEYSSPSLWRKVTFCLPVVEDSKKLCPEVIFARRYGAMFRELELIYKKPPSYYNHFSSVNSIRQLKLFLQALTGQSKLLSISFEISDAFEEDDYLDDDENYYDYCRTILYFLKSQDRLQCFKFRDCHVFKKAETSEILKVIFGNNRNTLRCLHLAGFLFQDDDADITVDDDLNFSILMNLEILEIEYTKLFENMILSFFEYRDRVDITERKGCLKEINLEAFWISLKEYDYPTPKIDGFVWKYFRKVFPYLRINFAFFSVCNPHYQMFLLPYMPLRVLEIQSLRQLSMVIGELLNHIKFCEINECLEVLKLDGLCRYWNIFPDLVEFTKACPELKILELVIDHPAEGLHAMFNSWLENRPMSLQVLKITLRYFLTPLERKIYTDLSDFYAPLLQPLELSFSFR